MTALIFRMKSLLILLVYERIICGTPQDPAWELGDKDLAREEEDSYPGDPARKIAMKSAAVVKKFSET